MTEKLQKKYKITIVSRILSLWLAKFFLILAINPQDDSYRNEFNIIQ